MITLSDAYTHMNNCEKSKMNIDCWNCNNKTYSNNLKISDDKKKNEELYNFDQKQIQKQNNYEETLIHLKLNKFENLNKLEECGLELNTQIHNINIQIQSKEKITEMIKNLKKELNKGESLVMLKSTLENKIKEKSILNEKREKLTKEITSLNSVSLDKEGDNIISLVSSIDTNELTKLLITEKLSIKIIELFDTTKLIYGVCNNTHSIYCSEIKSYDLVTKNCQTIIQSCSSYTIIKLNTKRFAYGDKHLIRISDIITGKCLKILNGHKGYVNCLVKLNENELASGSDDKTIKVWNLDDRRCLYTLYGHDNLVNRIIKLNQNQIVSGDSLDSIKIWDLNSYICLKTINCNDSVFCLVSISGTQFASGTYNGLINIWDSINENNIRTLSGHSKSVNCIIMLDKIKLVSGSADKLIKIWNINSGSCLKTLNKHSESIHCIIKLNQLQMVSGSKDKTIRIWDI